VSTLVAPQFETAERSEIVLEFPSPRRRRLRLWAWLLGTWILSGIYIVSPEQQAVVTMFGAVTAPRVLPGIHYALPWPIDSVYKLKVHQLRRVAIGGDVADSVLGRLQPMSSEFLSGDQNLLDIRVVAQYSVSEPRDFLFQPENVDRVVSAVVGVELSRRIAHTTVDDILTTEKIAIQNDVLQAAQKAIESYRVGATISNISIESVTPPPEAADAFRSVASAKADAIRIVNQAEGYANDLLPRARGEGVQLIEQAQAYKEGKVNRAAGDAARFGEVVLEYAKAPKVTSTRAYLEALEQILPKLKKLIIDSNGNVDLTVIRRDDNSGPNQTGATRK
jgi:membrane protease subunit HflK